MSKTFCPLPFNHLYILPTGKVNVCCKFRYVDFLNARGLPGVNGVGDINAVENLSDVLQSTYHNEIRHDMLAGKKIIGCESCYIEDEAGSYSMRQSELDAWGGIDKWQELSPRVEIIEVTFGNYCNLACRTCGPDLSTSWYDDAEKLNPHYPGFGHVTLLHTDKKERRNVNREWKPSDFKDLRKIKITGGEPLLHPDFTKFLNAMLESDNAENIEIAIFTNCSFIPKTKLLNSLLKFKNVVIYLSIDGTDSVHEYIRHNSSWEITDAAANVWMTLERDNHKKVAISLSPTVQLYNILTITDVFNWWINKRKNILGDKYSISSNVSFNVLSYPDHLRIENIIDATLAMERLEKFVNDNRDSELLYVQQIVKFVETGIMKRVRDANNYHSVSLTRFIEYTKDLDRLRNQDFKTAVPELYESMKKYFDVIPGRIKDK